MENLDPATGNQDPSVAVAEPPTEFNWKSNLNPDFANSPTMKLFPDTKEGFNSAVKSHLELQKMMGHDKVPVPKDANDTIAINLFKKAFSIPEKAEGYALPDAEVPQNMAEVLKFDKNVFQQTLHKHNLNPEQAKGLWKDYTEMVKGQYVEAVKKQENHMAEVINQMRVEWGDAYQSKVAMGQLVINKFAENDEMKDFLTASLIRDPNGIKFLTKIGEQFAENKIGDFKYQRYSLTPEEAQREIDSIRNDENHPYRNEKFSRAERDKAIEYVNSLYALVGRTKISE